MPIRACKFIPWTAQKAAYFPPDPTSSIRMGKIDGSLNDQLSKSPIQAEWNSNNCLVVQVNDLGNNTAEFSLSYQVQKRYGNFWRIDKIAFKYEGQDWRDLTINSPLVLELLSRPQWIGEGAELRPLHVSIRSEEAAPEGIIRVDALKQIGSEKAIKTIEVWTECK